MDVVPFLRHNKLKLSNTAAAKDFTAKFARFNKAYQDAWGIDGSIIHYHHLLWQHLPGQIKKWGAPFIWSASSMEKSHWRAHNKFHVSTQLGGRVGRARQPTDALFQLLQYEMRCIKHRIRDKYLQAGIDNLLQAYPGWSMTAKGLKYRKNRCSTASNASTAQELRGYLDDLDGVRGRQQTKSLRAQKQEIWGLVQLERGIVKERLLALDA